MDEIGEIDVEEYLHGLLERTLVELRHQRVFIASRERCHPCGVLDYDELTTEIDAALRAWKEGKMRLHVLSYLQEGE